MNYQKPVKKYCTCCNADTYHLGENCQECYSENYMHKVNMYLIIGIIILIAATFFTSCTIERQIVQKQFICQELSEAGGFYKYKFVPLNHSYANYLTIDSLICSKNDTVKFEVIKGVVRFR